MVDEILVHHARDLFILEGFMLHYVTPMAGRISMLSKIGLFSARAVQAPLRPMNTIPGIMAVVIDWDGLGGQTVCVLMIGHDALLIDRKFSKFYLLARVSC